MKALIIYATNSGGTRFASEFLAGQLTQQNCETELIEAWEVALDSLVKYDIVFFLERIRGFTITRKVNRINGISTDRRR